MANYVYYIVKFESITDGRATYRFAIRPNNSTTFLGGISDSYPSRKSAMEGIHRLRTIANIEMQKEAEEFVKKNAEESKHFKIWLSRTNSSGISYYMFQIREGNDILITSAHDYEHKQNCKDELISLLNHLDGNIKDWDEPEKLYFNREYFGLR